MTKYSFKNYYSRFSRTFFKHVRMQHNLSVRPYKQILQYGDPVLHKQCEALSTEHIKSTEVQKLIRSMVSTMRQHGLVGLAAPQIGVSKQIIVMEFTEGHLHLNTVKKAAIEARTFPLKIIINPKLTVTDPRLVKHEESCASIHCKVLVSRAYGVEVAGLNENGDDVKWAVTGWPARILQHEVDHLNGRLNIEKKQLRTPWDLFKNWMRWIQNG